MHYERAIGLIVALTSFFIRTDRPLIAARRTNDKSCYRKVGVKVAHQRNHCIRSVSVTAAALRSHPNVQLCKRSFGIKSIVIDMPNRLAINLLVFQLSQTHFFVDLFNPVCNALISQFWLAIFIDTQANEQAVITFNKCFRCFKLIALR